jgi:4-alpha-glucanotransferase
MTGVPPFPPGYRASGVLLHVVSLPSSYGIGDLGPAAHEWVDRLEQAGQRWWQALPLGPTGYGDSPYQSLSSFAGNELLISPDALVDDGLLEAADCEGGAFSAHAVEYEQVVPFKLRVLETAWRRYRDGARSDLEPAYKQFREAHGIWLDDYALFRALKHRHDGACYFDWPAELVQRSPTALARARQQLASEIELVRFAQFLLYRQAETLVTYAHERGVRLIGDLPFFVSPDSSDVWASPQLFLLDEGRRPQAVAGVPPDYFSAEGQLWGNPVYDWEALRESGYGWCVARLQALLVHVDVIRLDHFRAFAAAWHVRAGAPTAKTGEWVRGPGAAFFAAVEKSLGSLPFIAEDLGVITPDVTALRDEFRLPGTRVLQFAFDGNPGNPHLPRNYVPNTVAYTGTHDNATTRGWYEELPDPQRQNVWRSLGRSEGEASEIAPALIQQAWESAAALAIAPLQDVLNLGNEARMNVPGRADGNWRWRCTREMLSTRALEWLGELTHLSGRSPSGSYSKPTEQRRFPNYSVGVGR